MKIQSIKRRKKGRRVVLTLEDDTKLELPDEVVAAEGLRKGADLTPTAVADLVQRGEDWRCKEAALSLLSHRPRAEVELRKRLRAKSYRSETIDGCMADLQRSGLIDDEEFARMAARDRLRSRPMGPTHLKAELRSRGLGADIAAAAAESAMAALEEDELALARRAARKFRKRDGEVPASRRRRFYAFLARRGFDSEVIRQLLDETDDDDAAYDPIGD